MEYKQALIVRADLQLSKGKMAAQVAHAAVEASDRADPEIKEEWNETGCKKVVLEVPTLKELQEVFQNAKKLGLSCSLIKDAGRTELKPGTITVVGIGPDTEANIDKITGSLKLLS